METSRKLRHKVEHKEAEDIEDRGSTSRECSANGSYPGYLGHMFVYNIYP